MSKNYQIRNFQLEMEDEDEKPRSLRTKREKNHIKSLRFKRKKEKIRKRNHPQEEE